MAVALFDLDETLISGDSDYQWGRFLTSLGVVDGDDYEATNKRFYDQYLAGTLDIYEFARFAFKPLSEHPMETLIAWRDDFIKEYIEPLILPAGIELIEKHRAKGDVLTIITATNSFITQPIAALFKVDHLIATEPEMRDGKYTGELETPCFAKQKVDCLQEWLQTSGHSLEASSAYSDSHNDIPLLETVSYPHAVDPDDKLRAHASKQGWKIISLR